MKKTLADTYVYKVLQMENYIENIKNLGTKGIEKHALSKSQLDNILNDFRFKINNLSTKAPIINQIQDGKMLLITAENLYLPSWGQISTPGRVDRTIVNLFGKVKIKDNYSLSFNPREVFAVAQIGYFLSSFYENEKKIVGNTNIIQNATEVYMRVFYRILDTLYSVDSASSQGMVTRYLICKFFLIYVMEKDNDESTSELAFRPLRGLDHLPRLKTAIGTETELMYSSLPEFIKALPSYVPILKDLDLSSFLRKFLLSYGEKALLMIENLNYFIALIGSSVISGGYVKDFTLESSIGNEGINLYNQFVNAVSSS
jgi:hypothetical protein